MKNLLHKIKSRVIKYVFNRYYSHLEYPFYKADVERMQMPEHRQLQYYEDVSSWVNSEAFDVEHKAIVRDFIKELATQTLDKDQVNGYRQALIFVKNYEARLISIAEEFKVMKATSQRAESLK